MPTRNRPIPRLGREVAIVLAVKAIALLLIWSIWFAHPQAGRLSPERVADSLNLPHAVAEERSAHDAQP